MLSLSLFLTLSNAHMHTHTDRYMDKTQNTHNVRQWKIPASHTNMHTLTDTMTYTQCHGDTDGRTDRLTSTCQVLPRACTTRSSMGRRQAPQMGIPILSWQRRQYSSASFSLASVFSSTLQPQHHRHDIIHQTLTSTRGSLTSVRYIILMRAYTHTGGWAQWQRASTTFFTRKNSHKYFLCSQRRRGSIVSLTLYQLSDRHPMYPMYFQNCHSNRNRKINILLYSKCINSRLNSLICTCWYEAFRSFRIFITIIITIHYYDYNTLLLSGGGGGGAPLCKFEADKGVYWPTRVAVEVVGMVGLTTELDETIDLNQVTETQLQQITLCTQWTIHSIHTMQHLPNTDPANHSQNNNPQHNAIPIKHRSIESQSVQQWIHSIHFCFVFVFVYYPFREIRADLPG